MPSHHTATITNAMPIAISMLIPIFDEPSTSNRHPTNGMQLPI